MEEGNWENWGRRRRSESGRKPCECGSQDVEGHMAHILKCSLYGMRGAEPEVSFNEICISS